VKAFFKLPVKALGKDGIQIAKDIVLATKITKYNLNRATTHNKGVLNGIVGVANAIG
jgi:hydroxymethylglutaryl-CoA reductase